jgi:transcriptional regulator with XRE-family HTH domain
MEDETFGQVLREFRSKAGLSQEELGELTDLHRTYISLLERGINGPSLRTLVKLSQALGVTLTEMVSVFEERISDLPKPDGRDPCEVSRTARKPPARTTPPSPPKR